MREINRLCNCMGSQGLLNFFGRDSRFAENMTKQAEFYNFEGFLHNMVAAFYAFADKAIFFKGLDKFFSSYARKPLAHLIETSTVSLMSLRYSLKACFTPTVLMYPRKASRRLAMESSGLSPCVIMSNSGQYTVYPPLLVSGINSAVICKRCILASY